MKEMPTVRVPVHFDRDETTRDWHFHARIGDSIGVVGGGQATLQEARQAAAEAIAVALESHESDDSDGQVEYLDVAVG